MRVLTTATSSDWDAIIERSASSDAYHGAAYHRLAEWNGEGSAHLFVASGSMRRSTGQNERWHVALPLLIRPLPNGELGCDATSVYGYAGPVMSHELMPSAAIEGFQTELARELDRMGVVSVFSRLHPHISPHAVRGLGVVRDLSQTISIDTTAADDDAVAAYRKSHRRNLKRSTKAGLRCEIDESFAYLDDLVRIYAETMERTGASDDLRFDGAYFQRLVDELGDQAIHYVCFDGSDHIVGASIYLRGSHFLNAHLGGSSSDMGLISPATIETDTARSHGRALGLSHLNLGGGVGGQDDSLMAFKRGFSDRAAPFRIWKWIVDADRYLELTDGFFPAYRSPEKATFKYQLDPGADGEQPASDDSTPSLIASS